MTPSEQRAVDNDRRIELIKRSHRGGLNDLEQLELDSITATMAAWIEKKYPPPWGELEKLKCKLAELESQ